VWGCAKKKILYFNKQYTEAEYKSLLKKIKGHMKNRGEWGKFFFHFLVAYSGYNLSLALI